MKNPFADCIRLLLDFMMTVMLQGFCRSLDANPTTRSVHRPRLHVPWRLHRRRGAAAFRLLWVLRLIFLNRKTHVSQEEALSLRSSCSTLNLSARSTCSLWDTAIPFRARSCLKLTSMPFSARAGCLLRLRLRASHVCIFMVVDGSLPGLWRGNC